MNTPQLLLFHINLHRSVCVCPSDSEGLPASDEGPESWTHCDHRQRPRPLQHSLCRGEARGARNINATLRYDSFIVSSLSHSQSGKLSNKRISQKQQSEH